MPSAAHLPHATVISDFSKALCLSGLRIGWMIERDPRRRERYLNARSYFTVSSTVLGERLATLALRKRNLIYDRARRMLEAISRCSTDCSPSTQMSFSGSARWAA